MCSSGVPLGRPTSAKVTMRMPSRAAMSRHAGEKTNRDRYSAYPSMFSSRRTASTILPRFPLRKFCPKESSPLLHRKFIVRTGPGRLRGPVAVVIRPDLFFGLKDFLVVVADVILENGDLVIGQRGNPLADFVIGRVLA